MTKGNGSNRGLIYVNGEEEFYSREKQRNGTITNTTIPQRQTARMRSFNKGELLDIGP